MTLRSDDDGYDSIDGSDESAQVYTSSQKSIGAFSSHNSLIPATSGRESAAFHKLSFRESFTICTDTFGAWVHGEIEMMQASLPFHELLKTGSQNAIITHITFISSGSWYSYLLNYPY